MAIEVLSPGISNLDFRYVGKCTKCLGRFRWGLADAHKTTADRRHSVIKCTTTDCAAEGVFVTGIPVEAREQT